MTNTNKFKPNVRSLNRVRYYPNRAGAFYQRTDGTFIRAVPVSLGRRTMMRRCDQEGKIIERIRMSKKLRIFIRRARASLAAKIA